MSQESDASEANRMPRRKLFVASAVLGASVVASTTGSEYEDQHDATQVVGDPHVGGGCDVAGAVHAEAMTASVRDHGAVGDGITDDTDAINHLLAMIGERGAKRIYFPPGQYLHSGISVVDKTGFELLGPGELVATKSTVNEYLRIDNCTDFKLFGLQSRHQDPTARRETPARAISLTGCKGFEIAGCRAHHGEGVGIMLNHCSEAVVHGCRVHDTKADGIGLYGDTHHVTVTGNSTYETGDDGIAQVGVVPQGVRPHDNAIAGNTVGRSHARGIAVVGAFNTTVDGNTVETTRAGGIYVAFEPTRSTYGCTGVVVSGNVLKDANAYDPEIDQAAIFVCGGAELVEDVTIANNRINGARGEGIRVGGSDPGTRRVTVIGNSVSGAQSAGIELWSVEDVSVIGNAFTDVGAGGIYAASGLAGAVIVSGNTVRNPNTSGSAFAAIGLSKAAKATVVISANTVVAAASAAYGLDAPARAVVYGNNLNGTAVRGGADATVEIYGNVSVSSAASPADAAEGKGVVAIRDVSAAPVTPPEHGGILYVEDGALKYKGSRGTETTLGPA